MCAFVPPDIAAITAIGPLHLERMKSEAAIPAAKAENFEPASVAVLNVDDARRAALAALERLAAPQSGTGKRVVVTPGMVELGPRQADENAEFAAAVATSGVTHLVIVGQTNRAALRLGAARGRITVVLVDTREEA